MLVLKSFLITCLLHLSFCVILFLFTRNRLWDDDFFILYIITIAPLALGVIVGSIARLIFQSKRIYMVFLYGIPLLFLIYLEYGYFFWNEGKEYAVLYAFLCLLSLGTYELMVRLFSKFFNR